MGLLVLLVLVFLIIYWYRSHIHIPKSSSNSFSKPSLYKRLGSSHKYQRFCSTCKRFHD